jgi:NDP-sugar pyrophosphorylase family protein
MEDLGLMRELAEVRGPDFQTVIIVDSDDGRMFPLTEEVPKCLLPIANRPLLSYKLDLLKKSRATGFLYILLYYTTSSLTKITFLK